jgi:hypothetical protein
MRQKMVEQIDCHVRGSSEGCYAAITKCVTQLHVHVNSLMPISAAIGALVVLFTWLQVPEPDRVVVRCRRR